jgi:hypothetical protein
MPNPTYTEADLADLTPEERSAIEAEAGDNADILNELADGDDGTAAAPAAAPAADGTATPGAEGADGAAAPAAPAPYTADVDPAKLQADLDAEKKAITDARAEETEALRKLNDGEIDFAEYQAVRDKVTATVDAANDKIRTIDRDLTRATVASEMTAQQAKKAWTGMVNNYVTVEAKADGVDYSGDAGKERVKEFQTLVTVFGKEAAERGMEDGDNLVASRWALAQAREIMRARHGKAAAAAPAAGAPAAAPPAPAPGAPRHNLATLGTMPAAAGNVQQSDALSKAATLEGEALEIWLASQPRDVVDAIMAGT